MEKEKENIDPKDKLMKIGSMMIPIILGFLAGTFIIYSSFTEDLNDSSSILSTVIIITIFLLSFIIQIILHETGHLVFGLLSNYEFISFRIGTFTLVKVNGKFTLKKFNIQGTAGQCLMMPKSTDYKNSYYTIYNLGGVLLNLIVAIICFILYLLLENNNYLDTFLISMVVSAIYLFITNGIPMKISGVANDAYNLISIKKSDFMKYCFHTQLIVVGLLHKGIRMKDMPLKWFEINTNSDFSNPLVTSIKIFEANYYHDKLEFNKAKDCYEFLINYKPKIIKLYENEIKCDLLFYEIINNNKEKINELYTRDLKSYIKVTNSYISRKRLIYAYALIIEKDIAKSKKILNEIEIVKKTYPTKAELDSELEIIDYLTANFTPMVTTSKP